ncbi:hypothetical protein GQX73_g8835 [Xylaria multiplex]|uniref:DUF7779 domain-containing protein n=1 Tax=Xylaria multiplex TaxID=323545 RepID=A0A7C8MHI6_9PEZI|nr:hypothetical protein GQX73_g8835 [Xylaria multiplex]
MTPSQKASAKTRQPAKSQPWKAWFEPVKDADKIPSVPMKVIETFDDGQNASGPVDIIATEYMFKLMVVYLSPWNVVNRKGCCAMICGRENPGWRAIYDQTIHIIFIDSINNTTHGDFNKAFSRCAWSEIGESKTKRQDLDTLKDSTFLSKLKALCDQFNANISHYNTTGFYGEKETAYSIPRMLGYTSRKHRQLIPKELESLFKSTHTSIALDCDHEELNKPWLLIFDNVEKAVEDNSSSLGDFWPTGDKGSILITTRNDSVLGPLFRLNATIEYISGLPMQDSIDYLFKVTGIRQTNLNYEHAETIYERIRGHPLSLVTIASIVSSKRIDFKEYIDLYPNLRLFDEAQTISGPETYYPYSMSTAFHTALSGIEDSVGDNNAWRLLHLLSFLDPDGVEEEDLRQGAVGSNQPTLQDIVDHRSFEENRSLLCERNAIGRNTELKTLLMHRLTQDYCHSKMTSQSAQVAFDSAFYLLHKLWPVPERHSRHQQELWPTQERLVNHVVSLGNYWKISQEFNESTSLKASIQFAELLYNSAWYFYERGNFSSADTLLKVAKMYCHTNPTNCQVVLADIYGAYGSRYSECNEAQACFDNFSEQHRYIQTSIQLGLLKSPDIREALAEAGIGVGKMALKKYAEAEKAFRNCLEIWKDCPGEPSIYVPHLGVCLTLQGKLSEAEKLLTNIIAQRAAQFGERDRTSFRTGVIYLAYGNLQIKQKRFEEAYRTHLFAMEMLAETVGKEHHRYADACYKVGWHQHRRNELDAARNEEARVYFKLGEIAAKKGSLVEAKGNRDKAEQCRKIVHGQQDLPLGLEEDYDESIMFWSR